MFSTRVFFSLAGTILVAGCVAAQELPFQHSVEVFRNGEEETTAFALRLEQPFLAEEFEKSNYLRLRPTDENAFLIYPKETKFRQKHAEFFGRLKGEGEVKLELAYETVSENLDGSPRVDVRKGTVTVTIPSVPNDRKSVGPERIFKDWARKQNEHFARLLTYYPDESFFQYCLLQSQARYGIEPTPVPKAMPTRDRLETGLYKLFSGSLSLQSSLQRRALGSSPRRGAYNTHISSIKPPSIQSLDYESLLEERQKQDDNIKVQVHEIAKLIPADQYFLHFNSFRSLGELLDLASEWGDDVMRLQTLTAQDNRLQEKLEEQLAVKRSGLNALFDEGAASEVVVTGTDPYLLDGTDITLVLRITDEEAFAKRLNLWISDSKEQHPELTSRDFNYRGHQVAARYTNDRLVSSFMTRHEAYFIVSNSHRAVRHIIDAAIGETANLHGADDYRYISTILSPSSENNAGYYYASDAFIRRVVAPASKISQKRRVECFNNLVMQNNASMFFRLEYGRSPKSLSEMIEKRFIAADKIVCPHGGAYAFDEGSDTCTCSLHNRLRYLTPNAELSVLQVSSDEAAEYGRYKSRYQAFWQKAFNPVATRITAASQVRFETCVLPMSGSSFDEFFRDSVDKNPAPIEIESIAPSAVASMVLVPGRENAAQYLMSMPGVREVIRQDPTLTDLNWLGDRVSLHFCDGEIIYEIDPTKLAPFDVPMIGKAPVAWQSMVAGAILTANMPVYMTIDIENKDKAQRLLDQFSRTAFLKGGQVGPVESSIDAYRLPDYREHQIFVITARLHAITVRMHTALVGDRLVMATKPETLREVIDASTSVKEAEHPIAHLLFRLNRKALDQLQDDVQLHWAEKARLACHRNIISIYNFHQLYNASMDEIPALSEAKYGIRNYCPDGGHYHFDAASSQVVCSVHGNREASKQNATLDPQSSSARSIESIDQVVVLFRFQDEALIATVEIDRASAD